MFVSNDVGFVLSAGILEKNKDIFYLSTKLYVDLRKRGIMALLRYVSKQDCLLKWREIYMFDYVRQ